MTTENNGWIDLAEYLPPLDTTILLCCVTKDGERYITTGLAYRDDYGCVIYSDRRVNLSATHWMPLPQLP
ncbi:DUF551 domain-containing protein [Aggregatibacter kilianii]|uniref:DUF551 domain-containing protein n=1 Tax=Aggregatibacter kilianii TaxID=2025884 RepID=UPI000D65C4E8